MSERTGSETNELKMTEQAFAILGGGKIAVMLQHFEDAQVGLVQLNVHEKHQSRAIRWDE